MVTNVDPTKASTAQAIKPPPFFIVPLRQEHRYIKCLFYGNYGTGKTSLACSAADIEEMNDILMVNAESGTMSVEEADYIENRYLIDQVRAVDFNMVAYVQEFLLAHCKHRDADDTEKLKNLQARMFNYDVSVIDTDHKGEDVYEEGIVTKARLRKYRTIIVDSLTEIDTFSMYQLLGIQTDMKLDKDMDVAQFAEFRKNNQMMQLLVRAYRDLPMNVLLVASTQYTQDELKRRFWTPQLTGKLAGQVQGFVDIVGFMQTGKPDESSKLIPRRLYIQPIGQFDAKNRIASFKDSYIDAPTMKKIMGAFRRVASK